MSGRSVVACLAVGIIISMLLLETLNKNISKMVQVPHTNEDCIFEYKDTFGEIGTADDCVVTRTNENVQMFCGDDFIVEVKEIKEKCKEGEDNDGTNENN